MMLSHLPTLMAMSAFLLGIIRWHRTKTTLDASIAGLGLTFAMLCRPVTAAAFGLPFGLNVLVSLIWRRSGPIQTDAECEPANSAWQRMSVALGLGIPLLAGWALMLSYNHAITGNWLKSPYQVYTDIYTPRHVFGFNNVIRGEQHLGPRVIDYYDRWAQNLTPSLAAENVLTRWLCSWLWAFDLLPLLITTVVYVGMLWRWDRRWSLLGATILSLHAIHVPYWYVGIMGWHYVFETAPLWCLLLGGTTTALISGWNQSGRQALTVWWYAFLAVSIAGVYVPAPGWKSSTARKSTRFEDGYYSLAYPRRKHRVFRNWLEERVTRRPALVLVDQGPMEKSHLDLVVNEPGLNAEILLGRFRPGITNLAKVRNDFPDRHLFIVNPSRHDDPGSGMRCSGMSPPLDFGEIGRQKNGSTLANRANPFHHSIAPRLLLLIEENALGIKSQATEITQPASEHFRPVGSVQSELQQQPERQLEPLHCNRWCIQWSKPLLHSRSSERCSSGSELACSNES